MVSFSDPVAIPTNYAAPLVSFQGFADLPNKFYQGAQNRQQYDVSRAFQNGLPTDANGNPDYRAITQILASKGDINAISALAPLALQQQQMEAAQQPSPLLGGGMPQQGGGLPMASAPAPQPQAGAPQSAPTGDATLSNLVASQYAGGDVKGVTGRVASVLGVDPNATLTLGQERRAAGLIRRYSQAPVAPAPAGTSASDDGLSKLQAAIFGQESNFGRDASTSVTGARGDMQIEPGTFRRYASANENIDVPADNRAVGNRILADYYRRYNGDIQRAAVAYFSGPGNVAARDNPTPWKRDVADPNGKTVSSYVSDITRRMGNDALRQATSVPPSTRVNEGFSQFPPSAGARTAAPNLQTSQAAPAAPPGSPPNGAQAGFPVAAQPIASGSPAQAVAVAPQQQTGPIGPQVPLPRGYNDQEQAIMALRTEAARLSSNRFATGQAQMLENWADRIEKSIQPVEVRPGETLLDPRSGRTIFQAPGGPGGQVGQLVRQENAERAARGEPAMTAQEEISFIQGIRPPRSAPAMAVDQFKRDFQQQNGRAPSAEEITQFASNYSREQSYGRTAGSQGANVENAANEVAQLIPQALEASKTVPRGPWVPFNQLVQKWDQGTSDPAYNDFMIANFTLLNAYTRAMNPRGVPRIQERLEQHALGVLSTATDEKAYEIQVRRLWKEVQASKTATAETARGVTPGDINAPVPGLDQGGGKSGNWTTLDNGVRIRQVQ